MDQLSMQKAYKHSQVAGTHYHQRKAALVKPKAQREVMPKHPGHKK
jgi:hypothetical protein